MIPVLYRNPLVKRLAGAILASWLLTGCLEENLLWSPDGRRAAVIGPDGLYLCDPEGQLSALLVPGAYHVAWLGDSQQLVVARSRQTRSWSEIAGVLGPEQAGQMSSWAEGIWQQPSAGGLWSALTADKERRTLGKIYLRERYGEALQARVDAGEWDDIQGKDAEVHEVNLARITGGQIALGVRLHEGMGKIWEIRLAPREQAAALVSELSPADDTGTEDFRLLLAPLNGSGVVPVAAHVGAYPDWSADGRSLVYAQASGEGSDDDLRLGTLVQREMLDASGSITSMGNRKELAGSLFSANTRIRCLRDGRILFNAAEISLPVAAGDYGEQHEQLFAVDPTRQATLVRLIPRKQEENLPQMLAFFEISPDEKRVLFGDLNGTVCLLTLATGEVELVQEGAAKESLQGQPVWRKDGAYTFTRRVAAKNGQAPARKAEIILRAADYEKVLSQGWPDRLVNDLVDDRN